MADAARDELRSLSLGDWLWSLVAVPLVSVIGISIYAGSLHKAGVAGAALVVAAAAWILVLVEDGEWAVRLEELLPTPSQLTTEGENH